MINLICILFIIYQPTQAQSINTEDLQWKPLSFDRKSNIKMALESPSKKTSLTYREFLNDYKNTSLKEKVSKWLKDYISYGFELKSHKPLALESGAKGFFVEAYHEDLKQNFNQFMSLKKNKLVTLTCKSRDLVELAECRKTILSFSWKTNQESLK